MLDDRSKLLLKALVERYIADGQPVGSRTLSKASGLELSPATIRNVMSDLEDLGLIVSPHTSAGRIPTARGYRLFVDTMLTVQPGQFSAQHLAPDQPQKVISNAANLLSNLSQFVGVVIAPRRTSAFRQIEFLRLSEKRLQRRQFLKSPWPKKWSLGRWLLRRLAKSPQPESLLQKNPRPGANETDDRSRRPEGARLGANSL